MAIINFTMPDIWQDVADSKTITIKQNVRFHVRICSGNVQLEQIQNGFTRRPAPAAYNEGISTGCIH